MIAASAPGGHSDRGWTGYVLAAAVGAVGLAMAHFPMIASGLRQVQTDVGDTRLINYLLEHDYRWFRGDPNHARFWDSPFFYPARHAAAYTDTMIGAAPFYVPFRVAGIAPDTSFQLWMLTVSVLNYVLMLHLLRRHLGLSVPAASAGAFLFAFGASRVNLIGHQQHLPHFLSLVTVDALFGLFAGQVNSAWKRALLWLAATAGVLAQLTSGFYLGWFLVLSLAIAAVAALILPATRGSLLATARRDAPWLAASAVLAVLVLRPWVAHHRVAYSPRFLPFIILYLPRPTTWLYMGPRSWFESWTGWLTHFKVPHTELEQRIGVGLVTTLVAAQGLWWGRGRPSVRLLVTTAAVVFLCVTPLPPRPLFGLCYGLVIGAVALSYAGRRDRPLTFFLVVGIVLASLCVIPHLKEPLVGCALGTLVVTVAAYVNWEGEPVGRLTLGGLIVGLLLRLIPALDILAIGLGVGGLLALAAAVLGWRSRRQIEGVTLGGLIVFASLVVYWQCPAVWRAAGVTVLAAAAARRLPFRPPAGPLVGAVTAGLVTCAIFHEVGVAWYFFWVYVPGADALLFVSRVGLMMLIPWGIGLGLFFERLFARKRLGLAVGLGLVCLLEQGVTTPSFDKGENRRFIAALARRVGGSGSGSGDEAFYYSPHNSPWPPFKANLDAMWAGLLCGKPTLNGYSGGTPTGLRGLEDSNIIDPIDYIWLSVELDRWETKFGPSARHVRWIGGPFDPTIDDPPLSR